MKKTIQTKLNNTVKKLRHIKILEETLRVFQYYYLKKEVFVMEEYEEIILSPEMEEELSNGKGEDE